MSDVRQEAERLLKAAGDYHSTPPSYAALVACARSLLAQLAAQEQEIARLTRIGEMCGADADRWALKYRDAKSVRDAALAEVARLKGYMSEDDLAAAGLPEGQP